ncbi:retron-type reverse transcriptase [Longimicrobium terrae]|uniref:reverse transcriptase domain-containing protein n=1 Tax=Longimicrobium terrae TaxID=1639882 RepID=UPI00147278DE|nr:retron-type reverse transcriptase [Longimicrobium terrae]NNC30459.1 RNA-directed DNA polymerase [Longimicrobium terrae]
MVKVMPAWNPQRYQHEGKIRDIDQGILDSVVRIINRIRAVDARLPVILTLRHLSVLTDVPYKYLRDVVSRQAGDYKRVLLKKRVPGRTRHREISIPNPVLAGVQKWINENILQFTSAHPLSYAYHPESQAVFAATPHCGCRWLLKVDLTDFFHSISESDVYAVFKSLGYSPLLAFELARLTTMLSASSRPAPADFTERWSSIPAYACEKQGVLPQGAPTSPMLSNLVMRDLDEGLAQLAEAAGYTYTRYADDLAFSTAKDVGLEHVQRLRKSVLLKLAKSGFSGNLRKTVIRGPGARRMVLGILVDGHEPRLAREYKDALRQHLYYLLSPAHGPAKHAGARNLSVSTLFYHVRGKIAWAERVEPSFGSACLEEFEKVDWPPVDVARQRSRDA